MNNAQLSYLRGARPVRAKLERDDAGEKTFTMVFDNGAILKVVSDAGIYNYEELEHDMWIEVVPPPVERDGWIIMEPEND